MFRNIARQFCRNARQISSRGQWSSSAANGKPDERTKSSKAKNSSKNSNGQQDNSNKQAHCRYCTFQRATFETLGWLSAAFVVCRLTNNGRKANKLHERPKSGSYNSNFPIWRWLMLYASPSLSRQGILGALPDSSDDTLNPDYSRPTFDSEKKVEENVTEKTGHIDALCKELDVVSNEYIAQLNNYLAVSLIKFNDIQNGVKYLKANEKCGRAMFNLGVLYETGRYDEIDQKPDMQAAFRHYSIAASMGHKFAVYNLALFYLFGKGGIEVDEDKGNQLLEEAAQLGVKAAQQYFTEIKRQPVVSKSESVVAQNTQVQVKKDKCINEPVNNKQKSGMQSSFSAPNLSYWSSLFWNNEPRKQMKNIDLVDETEFLNEDVAGSCHSLVQQDTLPVSFCL